MKNIFHIARLISKERVGDQTEEEKRELADWIAKGKANRDAYHLASDSKLIQKKHDLYRKIDSEKSWNKVVKQIPELVNRPVIYMRNILKWAAVILLPLLATTYLLNELYWSEDGVLVEAGSSKASLQLADGETIYLEDYQGKDIKSGKEKLATNANNNLVYQQGEAVEEVLAYNTITTPVQGEYTMVLSDGTKVWLNAQSSLVYPVKFGKGKREVKLTGEAYFEVARDTSKAFIVSLANGSDVEVLGTSFNVMAYEDEVEVQTTLVEGKVKFAHEEAEVLLSPGEQSRLNKATSNLEVREVKTYQYSAWKDGKFIFNREPLGSVFRKMSRWYGVEVNCKDQNLLNRRISGVMNKYENVSELISLIEEVSPVDIELDNRTMIVSGKKRK